MRANTSASHAFGSTSLRRQVVMAARSALRWEPAKVQFRRRVQFLSESALGRIVRETNTAIFQETGKAIPALQHVIDRLVSSESKN